MSATMKVASKVTQVLALSVYLFTGYAYNFVFLRSILPAAGREDLLFPFNILFNVFWILGFWSYMQAFLTDPGGVPAKWQDFVEKTGKALPLAPTRFEWQPGKATRCKRCDIIRPERSHHCAVCEVCVLRMDHHCPWINNCVGFKNHKFFILLAVYTCIASIISIATTLPELLYCVQNVNRLEDGVVLQATYSQHEGFISAGSTIYEAEMTIDEAKLQCASMTKCFGFSFQGQPSAGPVKMYFKDKWDLWSTGWTSFHLEKANRIAPGDLYQFLVSGALSALAALLLVPLIMTHLPNASHNSTMIEENYDNMPNPFDQGSAHSNLAQVFGAWGYDWLIPIQPKDPICDGISFARSDERLNDQGYPDPLLSRENGLPVEALWKYRYHVRSTYSKDAASDVSTEAGPLSTLANWFAP
eukprot:TRINITY_DN8863_c0_g2_i1.p1 TRINITY_DN8863_c0_g2~~TRINITY_DN8863_c0_g2_i1.p1  ORF type:complete len:415 (+),score=46.75 TRINITY_DN8863_c0_g2_i1:86-1330(+)